LITAIRSISSAVIDVLDVGQRHRLRRDVTAFVLILPGSSEVFAVWMSCEPEFSRIVTAHRSRSLHVGQINRNGAGHRGVDRELAGFDGGDFACELVAVFEQYSSPRAEAPIISTRAHAMRRVGSSSQFDSH